jgi:putative peptidoglycan lipid II flippase
MQQDTLKSVFQSAARFFSGTFLSRMSGLGRDIAMANAFGTSPEVGAFFLAYRLSHLFRRVLGEGALQSAFVPKFESLRKYSEKEAYCFFRTLVFNLVLFLSLGIILGGLTLTYFSSDVSHLTVLMLPSLLFICLFGINAGLLHCHGHFFLTGVAPVAFNILWILGALYYKDLDPQPAMEKMGVVVIFCCFFQWAITVPYTLKYAFKEFTLDLKDLKEFLPVVFMTVMGVAANQINNALDPMFARHAELEGPAFLWFGIRVQQFPLSVIGVALSGAMLPSLARSTGETFKRILTSSFLTLTAIMIPVCFFLIVFSKEIITLFFGRGDFNEHSIAGAAKCLSAYSLGLVPMGWTLMLAPVLYTLGDFKSAARGSFLSVALNITLNGFFVFSLGLGSASVAIATSISAWVNAAFIGFIVLQHLKTHPKAVSS